MNPAPTSQHSNLPLVSDFNSSNFRIRLDILREEIKSKIDKKTTYKTLEEQYHVNRFYLWHIVNDSEYEPPFKVCNKLGIQKYMPAPVCLKCGEVHTTKRCIKSKYLRPRIRYTITIDGRECLVSKQVKEYIERLRENA
jgi:hypothetical protein